MKGFIQRKQSSSMSTSSPDLEQPTGRKRVSTRTWLAGAAGTVVIVAGLIFAGNQYVEAKTVPIYHVLVQGKDMGTIQDPSQLEQLFGQKRQEYQHKYPDVEMVLQTEGITTKVERAYKAEPNTDETLQKLDGMLKAYAEGVELKVEGKAVAVVKDQATAKAVLERVKQKYAPQLEEQVKAKSNQGVKPVTISASGSVAAFKSTSTGGNAVKSVRIEEPVSLASVQTDPNKVLTVDEAAKVLITGKDAPLMYEVTEGDTISSISQQFKVTQKEIFGNNPQVKEKSLQIGDELKLIVPKPPLTVTTLVQVAEKVPTAPEVEIRLSKDLPAGKSKVVRPGQDGEKLVNYLVTKQNGKVVQEQWLSQQVIKQSLKEVVLRGTKVPGKGSGQFSWPVSGATISSSFGSRWGKMHKGIDIVSGNRTIMAADDGVVSFTGQINGYGNVIIINHSNGYETLYGHLKSISTHSGQRVDKGDAIGVMGSTGRSTGTHLHFEIHKSSTNENPIKYLH
ncbi:M23 family metallopeptidase [Paenibacillus pini]|uniref:Peptidase n=1 Tax=Paenibacillus pini JCM 16418 TaxID=1236976 RepID=W7YBP8_9BACL|nr:M23 family metallopeptidase [Paenibacillus pini]GAF08265.1 peptidase [Paenibacillus pini JCM 16418]